MSETREQAIEIQALELDELVSPTLDDFKCAIRTAMSFERERIREKVKATRAKYGNALDIAYDAAVRDVLAAIEGED